PPPHPLSLHISHSVARPQLPPHSSPLSFFFTAPAPTEIYTLSLHDALPISSARVAAVTSSSSARARPAIAMPRIMSAFQEVRILDRKSTRLNSSHVAISYAVFCLKKKKKKKIRSNYNKTTKHEDCMCCQISL